MTSSKKDKVKPRKQLRKENRLKKKAKKHEFFSKKKERNLLNKTKTKGNVAVPTKKPKELKKLPSISPDVKAKNAPRPTNMCLQDEIKMELGKHDKEQKKLDKEMQKERLKKLKDDNEAEDREIRRLEKNLKLKKRSEKSISNFFAEDGLDYLLEVCNRKNLKDAATAEKSFKDDDSDFGEDYAQVTGKPTKKKSKGKKESNNLSDSDEGPEELPSKKGTSKLAVRKESLLKKEKVEPKERDSSDVEEQSMDEDGEFSEMEEDSLGSDDEQSDLSDLEENSDDGEAVSSGEGSVEYDLPSKKKPKTVLEKNQAKQKISKLDLECKSKKGKAVKGTIEIDTKKRRSDVLDDLEEDTILKNKSKKKLQKGELKSSKSDKAVGKQTTEKSREEDSVMKKPAAKKKKELEEIENPFSEDEVSSLGDDLDELSEEESTEKNTGNETWEDIYGRTRDKDGNVISAYQPPQMRKTKEDSVDSEKMTRLKKQMKGLLNRLAENNMVSISSQVESLYMSHSRNEMNETLWALLKDSLIAGTMTPERLIAEHAMLIAILGANIGGEVSAYCLQRCVTEWHVMWQEGPGVEDKRTNNVLLLLSYFYHFKLFHCTLLYDILELLLAKVGEKEVELVLLVLRTIGFSLRKEDPARLKDFVMKVQILANGQEAAAEGSRARFMLDTVLAIKNNNMNKIPNYDPEYGERIKKAIKTCIRKGNYNAELKITLEDLLKADERGRWWVVGSAWTGELPGEKDPGAPQKVETRKTLEEGFSSKLLELAKKQRMNTDTRRTVFCVIMSAEDYLDAFEKLLKLSLRGPSEREIMNVLLHCLMNEKQYNPYYMHLARRFCACNRKFQVMLQFAVWDKIQDLQSLSPSSVTNLAKFLGSLILDKSLAISVLKVVHFAELDKPAVRFIRQVLLAILLADSEEAMVSSFTRVANSKPLKLFREGLRLFFHHFVLRNSKAMDGIDFELLTSRVKLADSALSAADRGLSL